LKVTCALAAPDLQLSLGACQRRLTNIDVELCLVERFQGDRFCFRKLPRAIELVAGK